MTDLKTMTDEELKAHVYRLYCGWMYFEAAERGYDATAARAAEREYDEARAEVELRRCRMLAKPVCDLIDALAGSFKPC